tara:strand:+ start:3420 stop:3527 length:108 start_codon:yes stop_codon:yes gene_type:complete
MNEVIEQENTLIAQAIETVNATVKLLDELFELGDE